MVLKVEPQMLASKSFVTYESLLNSTSAIVESVSSTTNATRVPEQSQQPKILLIGTPGETRNNLSSQLQNLGYMVRVAYNMCVLRDEHVTRCGIGM